MPSDVRPAVPVIAIRREETADADGVRAVHRLAFARPDEADLVDRLRRGASLYLGLVAEEAGAVVGHILFTPVPLHTDVGTVALLALAPMAVRPGRQRAGIGTALVREGLVTARATDHDGVVVVGHPDFYPRFGFVRARPLGITSEPVFPDEAFLVTELRPGALCGRRGVVRYGPELAGGA